MTASINDDGRKANAAHARIKRLVGLGVVWSVSTAADDEPTRLTTTPQTATRVAKIPKPIENAHRCWVTVRWGSTRNG